MNRIVKKLLSGNRGNAASTRNNPSLEEDPEPSENLLHGNFVKDDDAVITYDEIEIDDDKSLEFSHRDIAEQQITFSKTQTNDSNSMVPKDGFDQSPSLVESVVMDEKREPTIPDQPFPSEINALQDQHCKASENDQHSPIEQSQPLSDNDMLKNEIEQSNTQPTRKLEPWENWDEDFYNLLSSSIQFVSSSAMYVASQLKDLTVSETTVSNANSFDDNPSNSSENDGVSGQSSNKINLDSTSILRLEDKSHKSYVQSLEEKYNMTFTINFLKETTQTGILLIYYDAYDCSVDLNSSIVTLTIEPGLKRGAQLIEPKLTWAKMKSAKEAISAISINILDIHSIGAPEPDSTANQIEIDSSPFIITTETGIVHVFECATYSERDRVLNGLRNVIAWLSYHLVSGTLVGSGALDGASENGSNDHTAGENDDSYGAQIYAMNKMMNVFLD